MQVVGYGIIMPIYSAAHLAISNAALEESSVGGRKTVSLIPVSPQFTPQNLCKVKRLPYAIILGYVIPTVLMALPLSNSVIHQYLVAVWQCYPVLLFILWELFANLPAGYSFRQNEKQKSRECIASQMSALHPAYSLVFHISQFTHMITFIILLSSLFPSTSSQNLGFAAVFIPQNCFSVAQMESMAKAALSFFQYDQYVGSTAMFVWVAVLHYRSVPQLLTSGYWASVYPKVFRSFLKAGPAGVFLTLMWDRDKALFGGDKVLEELESLEKFHF